MFADIWDMGYIYIIGSLVVFLITLLFAVIVIAIIDMVMNSGRLTIQHVIPGKNPEQVILILFNHFISEGYGCDVYGNRIVAKMGNDFWMGVRTFDLWVSWHRMGTVLSGEVYLKTLGYPQYWKPSKYGYAGWLPRRQVRKTMFRMYDTLGIRYED
ncbi:MAG: hypothetical protein ACMUHB_02255 [Thermoplasmatota archaeon]